MNFNLTSYTKGWLAELYVILFLSLKGYQLKKWRMRNYKSEIDLIMIKSKTLIGIEVKFRNSIDDGLYAITPKQQKNIREAMALYISSQHNKYPQGCRIDVCVVTQNLKILHLQNAF